MSSETKQSRRIRKSKPRYFDIMESFEIDQRPMYMNGSYFVAIKPQGIVLQFSIKQDGAVFRFSLKKLSHMYRYREEIEVISDQILIPLAGLCGMDPDCAILQYIRHEECHTRTMVSQYEKRWMITNNCLCIWGSKKSGGSWDLQVSDPSMWQTYSN